MKLRSLFLLLISFLISCNDNPGNLPTEPSNINPDTLAKKAFNIYQNNPKDAIPIFKQVAIEYQKLQNVTQVGIANLNIANIYDEHLGKIDSALLFAEKSLDLWRTADDSLQMANLYKYIGLLQGKKGQFDAAKTSTLQAISIYNKQGFLHGVAVSKINLADTYFREKDYEKSLEFFNKSKKFWSQKNDKSRMYTDNILGIKVLTALNQHKTVDSLINENKEIQKEIAINDFVKSKFETLLAEIEK